MHHHKYIPLDSGMSGGCGAKRKRQVTKKFIQGERTIGDITNITLVSYTDNGVRPSVAAPNQLPWFEVSFYNPKPDGWRPYPLYAVGWYRRDDAPKIVFIVTQLGNWWHSPLTYMRGMDLTVGDRDYIASQVSRFISIE